MKKLFVPVAVVAVLLGVAVVYSLRTAGQQPAPLGGPLYALHKTADVNVYVMLERYADQAALDTHRAAPHFKELGRKLGDYLAGRPDVQVMQEV